jgi:hypothetical protein
MTVQEKRQFIALTQSDGMEINDLGFLNNQLVELGMISEPDFDMSSDDEEELFGNDDRTELF